MSLTDKTSFYEVQQEITCILKVYPGFSRLTTFKKPFAFRRYDYDQKPRLRLDDEPKRKSSVQEGVEEIERHSQWRARTKLIDFSLANDFDLFMTFTFADQRFDVDTAKRRMGTWLNNQRRLHGAFRYLIAPEYHKNCEICVKANVKDCPHSDAPKALHFHALFGDYKGSIVDRNHVDDDGRKKYDIDSYRLGMATAKKIESSLDDHQKVAHYVAKYITKDMPKFHGKQRYWRSNGLKLPLKMLNPLLTQQDMERFNLLFESKDTATFELREELTGAELARIANYGLPREDDLRVTEW